MDKEKLKNMFKGKKKTENLIVLIVILIVTVVAINYVWNDDKKDTKSMEENNNKEYESIVQVSTKSEEDDLSQKLEKILSEISGVGKVKVMITYYESSTVRPVYNEDSSTSNVNETDTNGGVRSTVETDVQKEVIFKENTDGSKEPVTQSVVSPKIEGAVVVASGADNTTIKANIIQAVEAATGLATHKIQVFKMEDDAK